MKKQKNIKIHPKTYKNLPNEAFLFWASLGSIEIMNLFFLLDMGVSLTFRRSLALFKKTSLRNWIRP